jgi:hypothetical protein
VFDLVVGLTELDTELDTILELYPSEACPISHEIGEATANQWA